MGDSIEGGNGRAIDPELDSTFDSAKKEDERLTSMQKALRRERLFTKIIPLLAAVTAGVLVFGFMHDKYHEQMRDRIEEAQHNNNDIRNQLAQTIHTRMDVTLNPEDHTVTVRIPESNDGPQICDAEYVVNNGQAEFKGNMTCTRFVPVSHN